ncbi:MAG: TRAP transporter substrate-binding protein [Pseudomonadota bacterium]
MKILAAAAALAAIAVAGQANAADITLKYAHPTSTNSTGGRMAEAFKDKLEELSGGTMSVQIFPDGQLGKLSEMNELVASGTIQMSHNTWGSLSVFVPEAGALDSPYIFENPTERQTILTHPDSKIVDVLNEELKNRDTGLYIVAPNGASGRHVTCNRAIYSPEDLEGVKFRAIPFPVFIATVKGMGAIPVPIEYSELTTALATGLADCQENPLTNIYNDKLYENQSHIMMTNHIISGGPALVNRDFFEGLTEKQQGWIVEAATTAANAEVERGAEVEAELRGKLEDIGKIFITADDGLKVDEFATQVSAEMRNEFGDQYDRILNMVSEERASLLN